jgi:hypothetical protein
MIINLILKLFQLPDEQHARHDVGRRPDGRPLGIRILQVSSNSLKVLSHP